MPIVFKILAFFASFLSIALLVGFVASVFNNKRTAEITDRFIAQSITLNPLLIKDIKLRYWEINGLKITTAPANFCDLYLFENSLAVVRRQNFIFKVLYAPFIITSDIEKSKALFNYLKIYKPDKILFKSIVKEVEIKFTDLHYERVKTDMTFRVLSDEQVTQLKKIGDWV